MSAQAEVRPGLEQPKPINVESVVNRVKTGDPEAFTELDEYLRPRLRRMLNSYSRSFFGPLYYRLQGELDNTIQEGLIRVWMGIPTFDPKLGKGDFEHSLFSWSSRITIDALNEGFRKHTVEVVPFPLAAKTDTEEDDETFEQSVGRRSVSGVIYTAEQEQPEEDLRGRLKNRLTEILALDQWIVVQMKLEGKDAGEIAEELSVPKSTVNRTLAQARDKVEEELFRPAGLMPITNFSQAAQDAVRQGRARGVLIFDRWYAEETEIARRGNDNSQVDQPPAPDELILLGSLSPTERRSIKANRNFSARVVNYEGKVAIRKLDLEGFREIRLPAKPKRLPQPDGLVPLVTLASTGSKYDKLREAAQKGKLPARKTGRWWFTTEEAVSAFLSESSHETEHKERADTTEVAEKVEPQLIDLIPSLMEQIAQVLSESHNRIVNLVQSGKSNREIAESINLKEQTVKSELSRARSRIEDEVLTQHGFRRLANFGDEALQAAARKSRLSAYKFLHMWYATEGAVKSYTPRKPQNLTISFE